MNTRILAVLALAGLVLTGCATVYVHDFFFETEKPAYAHILESVDEVVLGESTAAEVLEVIHKPEYDEILSQSKSVVASAGLSKRDDAKGWFRMVSFYEEAMTARRKYVFIYDERPKFIERTFSPMWEGALFTTEMALRSDVLDEPYATDNQRRIAIVKRVLENFDADIRQVDDDNEALHTCGRMFNQILRAAITELERSPGLAARLDDAEGMEFHHMNLRKSRIGMVLDDDIVRITATAGASYKLLENIHPELDMGR